jgi:hypothetical protein
MVPELLSYEIDFVFFFYSYVYAYNVTFEIAEYFNVVYIRCQQLLILVWGSVKPISK